MMNVLKVTGIVIGVIALGIIGVLAYLALSLPSVGDALPLKVNATPKRIARGDYLANHVTVCIDCHSTRDFSLFSGPVVHGTLGKGGELFDQQAGFPGSFTAKNITPAGIGGWTDGEIYRAITTGVSRDGHAFFPVMPYPYYSKMNDEDVQSIIAYVRTLKPVDNKPADSKADFPFNFILNTIPKRAEPMPLPDANDEVATGKYLVMIAGCVECHTPVENGQIIQEKAFSGGRDFELRTGTIYSANITPDKETGIGNWTKETFIARFKAYADNSYRPQKVGPQDLQTVMPWTMYGGMNEQDLGAMYVYMMSLKSVPNKVTMKFKPHVALR